MKRYSYSSCIRCWNIGYIHSFHWKVDLVGGGGHKHMVFNIGCVSNLNRHFRSSHWGRKI